MLDEVLLGGWVVYVAQGFLELDQVYVGYAISPFFARYSSRLMPLPGKG
jgi:hypothetical protein